MATNRDSKKPRKPATTPEETALEKNIENLSKAMGEKPTEAQKSQMASLKKDLGGKRFVRIANKRVPKALKALEGIANLGGASYVKTPEQIKAICGALSDAVKVLEAKLSGTKKTESGFTLPTA